MTPYYPFFRGKQFELITIRECASLFAEEQMTPIIEPVKQNLNGLKRSIKAMMDLQSDIIVIENPFHGDFKYNNDELLYMLDEEFGDQENLIRGILLNADTTLPHALELIGDDNSRRAVIHNGFRDGITLANELEPQKDYIVHVFNDDHCGRLYQKGFRIHAQKAMLRDGFIKRKNSDYPPIEFFSDLHVTYEMESVDGFSDFLTVGDSFSAGGGPAYAVAIHLTFIDSQSGGEMHIHHFISDRRDTPKDPAGKFLEALDLLVEAVNAPNSQIYQTSAVEEFLELHDRKHFPGLGYVKKLSMKHHIETLALYNPNPE